MENEFKISESELQEIYDYILVGREEGFYFSRDKHCTISTKDCLYKIIDLAFLTKTKNNSYLMNFIVLCGNGETDSFYYWIDFKKENSILEEIKIKLSSMFLFKKINEVKYE
jgi:hypothetical protein